MMDINAVLVKSTVLKTDLGPNNVHGFFDVLVSSAKEQLVECRALPPVAAFVGTDGKTRIIEIGPVMSMGEEIFTGAMRRLCESEQVYARMLIGNGQLTSGPDADAIAKASTESLVIFSILETRDGQEKYVLHPYNRVEDKVVLCAPLVPPVLDDSFARWFKPTHH